ncbi:hypothetical protein Kfla_3288 [Kribbella flavida DSM 17836]|uniref:Uncharacterized protein n=1 Tax=Kribbella flavida (strain DSM 17836 / JCM 10339 / NBRC 14399) TaxID=479435 RepID=D2Q4N5_KRIFD|nr:hypothetical protein [Kribbella flavida]ADB32349.1 hypothetical protein Kfla_3288 [Kribbella flavida DSM 17836]
MTEAAGNHPDGTRPVFTPAERARAALGVALGVVVPEAMALDDGRVRLSGATDVLERDAVGRLDTRLAAMAQRDDVTDQRLLAEAVALVGAEVDHSRGGSSPVDGATAALDRMLDLDDLPDDVRDQTRTVLRAVLETNPLTTETAVRRRSAEQAAERPPLVADSVQAAQDIRREAELLSRAATPPVTARGRGRHRREFGGRHRRPTAQTVRTPETRRSRSARPENQPALAPTEALGALREVRPGDLSVELTAPMALVGRPQLGVVTTAEHGPQYFRVDDQEPPKGLAADTTVRSGSQADPHVVRIASSTPTDQLPRVWASQIGGTLRRLDSRNAEPTGLLGRLKSTLRGVRGRDRHATSQYDEFRLLSRHWREEQLRPSPDPARSADLRGQLEELAATIERKEGTAPAMPWSEQSLHVIAPDRTATARPEPNTPAHLREQVVGQISGLEKAAEALEHRAELNRTSATTAQDSAAETLEQAEEQEGYQDSAAGERGRRLRKTAAASMASAGRHTLVAASCDTAAAKAKEAGQAYQELLDGLDSGVSGPELQSIARNAETKVDAYRTAAAATLPSPDIQHVAISSGRFPHLTKLTSELNQSLAEQNNPYRFTPEVLHRRLRGHARRVLSPDGLVLTVGNDPRADVSQLTQFKLHLRPGELREVLDSPVTFDEGALAQLRQGGYSIATSLTETLTYNGGVSAKTITAALPDSSAVKAVSQVVDPGVEHAVGRSHGVTGGAQRNGVPGSVEVFSGILPYRSDNPAWGWQVRHSALAPWSQARVVDSGAEADNTHLLLGIVHDYTVPPPTDTVRLADLNLDVEPAGQGLPEHVASRVDGLDAMADESVAQLQARLGKLDRTALDEINSLLHDDGTSSMSETTQPGGLGRLIHNGGRPVAYAQLETFVVRERAELLSGSDPDHKIEGVGVGFSGASGSQSFGTSSSTSASLGVRGSGLADLGSTDVDLGPSVRGSRNVSREDSLSVSDVAIRPSVRRTAETVGIKVRLVHRLTFHRLDKDESFVVDGEGDAVLRMAAKEALHHEFPVPKDILVLDENGAPQLGPEGRVLTRGDAQPTDQPLKLPVWFGDEPGQLRGAGPALIQDLRGAPAAYQAFVRHLSAEGMVPPLDDKFRPIIAKLTGEDPVLVTSQLANLERVGQQLSKTRLETGYEEACQGGIVFALTQHRVGRPPQQRSYRNVLLQDFENAKALGLNTSQTGATLNIGSNTTVRSRGRSKGLPWLARLGFSNKPSPGQAGGTPDAGASYGRSALGRFVAWTTGTTVNGVASAETSAPLADVRLPHRQIITEVFPEGDSEPIVEVAGSAKVSIDSETCDRGEPQCVAIAGAVDPHLLQSATWHHLDAGDVASRLAAAMPAAARADTAAMHHLAAFVSGPNLIAHPEMLTSEYTTGFVVSPVPSDPAQAVAQRGLTPRRGSISLKTRIENLRYVGSGHPVIGDINLTLDSSGFTTGSSTGHTVGVGGGSGEAEANGDGWSGSLGVKRSAGVSSSSSQLAIRGVERLNIKDGQHYQFVGDLVLEAKIKAAGAKATKVDLDSGSVMLTLPERDALRMYGHRQLNLPLEKVSDAVERLLDGNLSLDRRTTTTLLRRYQREKSGLTTGLAATHTDARLKAKLRDLANLTTPTSRPEEFEQVAAKAQQVAETRAEATLPEHYRTTMGAGLIDRNEFRDSDGHRTTLEQGVQATVRDGVPDAAQDPAVQAAIRSSLAGTRFRGHAEKLKDPAGLTLDYPFGGDDPGVESPRNLRIRIRKVAVGPVTIDRSPAEAAGPGQQAGTPDQAAAGSGEPAAGKKPTENALIILQGYDYVEDGRSITRTTGYSADVGAGMTDGDSGSAGLSTELTTSHTVGVTNQNTRLSRALWSDTVRAEQEYRIVIDVEETPGPGAETKGAVRQTLDRLRSEDKRPEPLRRELSGKITLLVPASDVNQPPVQRPEIADHRAVTLPHHLFLRGIQLHDENGRLPDEAETIEDRRYEDALVTRVAHELSGRGWLTQSGVEQHRVALRDQLTGSARRVAFERSDGVGSPWTTPLPVPGHGSRQVVLRLRADLAGLQLLDPEAEGTAAKAQLGDVYREQTAVTTTTKSTRTLPTSQNLGTGDSGTGLKAGVSFGDQAAEKGSDTTGDRIETNSNVSGQVVTVELLVTFHVDARRQHTTRDHKTEVDREQTFDNVATGVATLTVFRHDYEQMLARMEAGQPPLRGWDPSELAKTAKRLPVHRMTAREEVRQTDGTMKLQPYRPLVEALATARRDNTEVVLTVQQANGRDQVYRALPNGTMTGKNDNGYGAAFATLHPSLALLAEGQVDLRALYESEGTNGRFSGSVVRALEKAGIPASALTGLDHTRSTRRTEPVREDGTKPYAGRQATVGKSGSGMAVQ